MKSSFHTLEKIAKQDSFDKKAREEYVEKKIEEHSKKVWNNIDKMLCVNFFSLGLAGYSANEVYNNKISLGVASYGLLGAVASIFAVGSILSIAEEIKDKKQFKIKLNKLDLSNTSPQPYYCYIDGRISRRETDLEREYGGRIMTRSSLAVLEYEKKRFQNGYQYGFIDHVILKDFSSETSVMEGQGFIHGDGCMIVADSLTPDTKYFHGSYVLQRGDEVREFKFKYVNEIDEGLTKLFDRKSEEVAFVYKLPESPLDPDNNGSLEIVKLYYPHP